MTGTGLFHDRDALVAGLRDLADWLETDCTIPTPPDVTIGIRFDNAEQVERFARVHNLGDAKQHHSVVYVAAQFGPVTYRVYAPEPKR